MKTLKFEDKDSWFEARRGKITGTRLKDIIVKRGNGKKIGFYEIIAERLAMPADEESPLDRGVRLEEEAIARFAKKTGKKVDTSLVIWQRDDNENITVSPDGFIGEKEAVEAKCLASAKHIEAYLTGSLGEHEFQAIQYFIVNDKLKTLHFVFYDPRIPAKDFFVIEIKREDIEDKIKEYLEYQVRELAEIEEIITKLTF